MYGWTTVDTRVEQRDRDAGAREPGNPDVGAAPTGDVEDVVDAARVDRSGNRGSHREDAPHVGIADDDREAARVERGGKAVEHPVVRMLRLDRGSVEGESRDDGALGAPRGCRPRTLLLLGRDTARRAQLAWRARAWRARRSSGRRAGRTAGRRAGSPSRRRPTRAARRRRSLLRPRGARPTRSSHHADRSARVGLQAADAYASRARASGEGTGSVNRAAEAIMAALSVQSESGARAASGSAARSSVFAATPPTTAIRSMPVVSAPGGGAGSGRGRSRAGTRPPDRRDARRGPRRRDRGPCRGETVLTPENERSRPGTRATGKRNASGSPWRASASISAPPGIRKPEESGTLVERLTGGVVERRAEQLERATPPHRQQERVTAAREQADEGRLDGVGPR